MDPVSPALGSSSAWSEHRSYKPAVGGSKPSSRTNRHLARRISSGHAKPAFVVRLRGGEPIPYVVPDSHHATTAWGPQQEWSGRLVSGGLQVQFLSPAPNLEEPSEPESEGYL